MASYFQFLSAFILIFGVQGGLLVPPSPPFLVGNNHVNHQIIDMGVLLNRLDQLEAKVEQHELKINSQQIEINQLKKKNADLEEENHQLILAGAKEVDVTSRDFLARSCFELKTTNPTAQSGVYLIDPDGQIGGDPSIQVYCDMTTQTTSVFHDTEVKTDVTACLDPGCYTKAIAYNATMRQLAALADISSSCKQYVRFDSFVVPLEYNNTEYGYWNDRNGAKQIFWAGPATSQHTCQCGIENNCVERSFKCNADALAPIELFDEGFITATELLPITRLSFGRTSLPGAKASYTLGRFDCTGQAPISSKPTNCRDLFKMGHTLSGFYDVKSSNNQISSTYCDFTKASTEPGYETRYGFVDVKSSSVHFFVTRTSDWSTMNAPITFEKQYLNVGGGMNINSGVFKATKAGIYAFSFSAEAIGTSSTPSQGRAFVTLNQNGVSVAYSHNHVGISTAAHVTASVHATLKLNVGDEIKLSMPYAGSIGGDSDAIQFMGSLLEEDLVFSK